MRQAPERRLRSPGLEPLFVTAFALFGFRLGARPIGDNSMFVHLRTGMDIVRTHTIPRRDPYSFTAHGHPWVVQSWLPEWTYGWAHDFGGYRLVVVEQAVLMAMLALLLGLLARAGTPLRTALAAGIAVGAGAAYWVPRPLMFGLICMALTVLVVERRWSRWWLIPILLVWVSSHGSFVLAVAWLGARGVGEAIDKKGWPADSVHYAVGLVAGLAVSVLNPLGPKLLTFPLAVQEKQSVFKTIVEWHSPNFQTAAGEFSLVFVVVALLVLLQRGAPWTDSVPVVGFIALGLIAQRNLPLAAVVMAPALGRALAPGRDRPTAARRDPSTVNMAFAVVLGLAFAIFTVGIYRQAPLNLKSYPVAAINFLERSGLRGPSHHVAQQDVVGCFFDLEFGAKARVFVDDRYDMFPLSVSNDYEALLKGNQDSLAVLDRRQVDVVLWDKSLPLVTTLRATGKWQQAYKKGDWVVLHRS
ncbi:MAG: hypothetical protein E6G57_12365 [Actinobacteria bacterium]|nr:MAG: hypothetical protein E6G57_12365 [Actinomycetota bacterium]